MYPGADYSKIASQSIGAQGQFTQGVDPDWTALAQAYGFIQNPFPQAGTEGQDQMRFLATLKNIADAQLGGANGRYAQMSPGNPSASMPFGMRQWMSGLGPLYNSIQGRMLMPANQADMFGGGYQFGPIDTSQQSGLMAMLQSARQGGPVGQGSIASGVAGPSPVAGGNTQAALPAAGETSAGSDSGQTAAAAQQVTGGNDTSNNPPTSTTNPTVSAATTTQTSGTQDIANALKAQDDSLPKFGYDTQRKGDTMVATGSGEAVAHLENGRWTQSNDESNASQRATAPSRTAATIGQKVSDLGAGVHGIVQQINQLDLNARNQLISMLGGR